MGARKFDLHFLVHSVSSALRRKDGARADKYWEPINQIWWELSCLLRESGFVDALPRQVTSVLVLTCYGEEYGFKPSESHLEGKNQFKVYVHLDARDYWSNPADEERYWPFLRVCLEALGYTATHFKMPQTLVASLEETLSKLPPGPPWPPLPPFDIADVERAYAEAKGPPVTADAAGRIRTVKPLDAQDGVLWIMCGPATNGTDASVDRLQGDLREFVAARKLGEWDGDSRSGSSSEISFRVKNLAKAADAIEKFLRESWPSLDFVIGDEYEPQVFEQQR